MNPNSPQPQIADTAQFGQYSDWAKSQMDKGVSSNVINQALQQNKLSAQPEKPKSEWWQDLLPAAGGILGAALAPETGGLSLLAAAGLSGLGGAAGQVAKNATMGEDPLQGNVLSSGIENAVGGGIGSTVGKIGAGLAKKVVAPAAEKTGVSLLAGQGKGALTNEDAHYLFNNGVTDLKQMGDIHPVVTGPTGALNNAVENTLHNAADTSGIRMDLSSLAKQGKDLPGETVMNAVRDAGISGDSGSVKSVQDFIQGQLEKHNQTAIRGVPQKGGGTLTSFDNGVLNSQHPLDALNMTRNMDSTASTWLKSSSPNIQAQGRALQNVSNTIKDNLYGPETAIGKMGVTDQVREQALADLEPLKKINPKYYEAKAGEVNQAQTIADLRAAQAPDVRASMALQSAQKAANTSGGNTVSDLIKVGAPVAGMSMGGPVGMAAGMIAPKVLGSDTATVAGTNLMSKLSKAIGSSQAQKIIPLLSRIGGITTANLPNMGESKQQGVTNMNGGMPVGGPGMMDGGQPSDYNTLIKAMMDQAILAPDLNPGATSLLQSIAPQLQQNQLAKSELGGLPQAFAGAGGGQGIGGITSMLSGLVPGTSANVFQGRSSAAAEQLAKALGISPQAAAGLLPGLMQSPEAAGQQQGVLSSIYGALPS